MGHPRRCFQERISQRRKGKTRAWEGLWVSKSLPISALACRRSHENVAVYPYRESWWVSKRSVEEQVSHLKEREATDCSDSADCSSGGSPLGAGADLTRRREDTKEKPRMAKTTYAIEIIEVNLTWPRFLPVCSLKEQERLATDSADVRRFQRPKSRS